MQELANRDALTGIGNKTAYDAAINRIKGTGVGLAVIDLNNLKKLNDTYGHDKGNIAIRKLAGLISRTFVNSPVFRIGGDEFVVIMTGPDYDNFDQISQSFYRELEMMVNDTTLEPWEKITAALGASFYEEGDDMNSLFKRADQMMYKKKKEMKASQKWDISV